VEEDTVLVEQRCYGGDPSAPRGDPTGRRRPDFGPRSGPAWRMANGSTEQEAVRKIKSIALEVWEGE
jgi:hypothetical protein